MKEQGVVGLGLYEVASMTVGAYSGAGEGGKSML